VHSRDFVVVAVFWCAPQKKISTWESINKFNGFIFFFAFN
jgi:hypothetical protein